MKVIPRLYNNHNKSQDSQVVQCKDALHKYSQALLLKYVQMNVRKLFCLQGHRNLQTANHNVLPKAESSQSIMQYSGCFIHVTFHPLLLQCCLVLTQKPFKHTSLWQLKLHPRTFIRAVLRFTKAW